MSSGKQAKCDDPIEFRAAIEVQQDLAIACSLRTEVVWDVFALDQHEFLLRKLEYMFPDDKKVYTLKRDLRRVRRHNANVKELRLKLFKNIWEQRKYTNGALLLSIIYIIVTAELNMEKAKFSHNYTIHPIFRTRRCLNSNSSAGCCMIFIDEKSRIYQNWNDFVENNELPLGTMIAPAMGCYSFKDNYEVKLEYALTPAYYKQSVTKMDNFFACASVVSQAAAMIHPVCAVLAVGTKTYETVRDYQKMSANVERGTGTKLRANLNLTGNIICLTSSAVTFGAYMSVPTGGALSLTAGMSIQAINSAATVINCTKCILTTYDIFTRYFMDDEELNFNDLMAFGSSLILLTHSINNMVITTQIGNAGGGNAVKSLLQNKIKAGLTLISGEVIKYAGNNGGNYDLLRLINDIPYKDVLRNIHTMYTNLSYSGFLTTLSVLGSGALEVLPGLLVQVSHKEINEFDSIELSKHYGLKFVKHIANSYNFIDVLNGMGVYFSATIVQMLLNQTRIFIETMVDAIDSNQNTFLTTEMVLFKMFSNTVKNYKNYSFEFLEKKRDDILLSVMKYFQSLNPKPSDEHANKQTCNVCGGYYYLTKI